MQLMISNEEGNEKKIGVAWYDRKVKMTHGKEMDEGVWVE